MILSCIWTFALLLVLSVGITGCGDNLDCRRLDDGSIECGIPDEGIPTPSPTPIPSPTPEGPLLVRNPVCQNPMGTDGGGGFLWKPKSESGGTLVVLLPGKFQSQFDSVKVFRRNKSEDLRFTGFSNYDADGLRQTWRATREGGEYTGRVEAQGGNPVQTCIWMVDNPERRQD